jgi:hypothetical protein
MKTARNRVLWEKLAKKEEFLKYEEDGQLFPLINVFAALAEEGNKKKLVNECQDFLVHFLARAQIYEDTSAPIGLFVGVLSQETSVASS